MNFWWWTNRILGKSFTRDVHLSSNIFQARIPGKFIVSITEMNWYVWVKIVLSFLEMHASWKWISCMSQEHIIFGMTIMKPNFYADDYDVYRTRIDAYFSLLESLKCLLCPLRVFGTKGFLDFKLYWFENRLLTWKTCFWYSLFDHFSPS